ETTVSSVIAVYLSVNRSGENNINRLHRNFLSLPYTRNQHSSLMVCCWFCYVSQFGVSVERTKRITSSRFPLW
ncbi:hypothetical protein, partial [Vibrio alginolyticus]|uniref:hypothetical protein n=1 Tax=Vibrio alginolyticus TaxID=663 RepID=UPI001C9CB1AA